MSFIPPESRRKLHYIVAFVEYLRDIHYDPLLLDFAKA